MDRKNGNSAALSTGFSVGALVVGIITLIHYGYKRYSDSRQQQSHPNYKCILCLTSTTTATVVLLACGHYLCRGCHEVLNKMGQQNCPLCQKPM